jgi:glycosyltransferase involved in cell wall biosynthesis
MALPLLQSFEPSLVVYDCMDELAAFRNAPKQLLQRESALLNIADLCFTGGPSLYNSKKDRHANAHCFSSSVDAKHFQKALDREYSHPDQANIAHPRLGFYGVIDERFDTELIREMAAARPDWQIVLVGPVVKIDPAHLPQAANIHYMGQRTYEELPKFLAGWDVCLLPFAMNESTKFISPTKVLEYMAAELPSVSTPITDVKVPYSHVVEIAATPAEFIAACDRMLALSGEQKADLAKRMRAVVANTSWDKTAGAMHKLIQTTEPGKRFERLNADLADIAEAGGKVSPLPLNTAHKQPLQQTATGQQPIKAQAAE